MNNFTVATLEKKNSVFEVHPHVDVMSMGERVRAVLLSGVLSGLTAASPPHLEQCWGPFRSIRDEHIQMCKAKPPSCVRKSANDARSE